MSKASLELGGGNWGTKDGNLLAYAQGNESSNLVPREFTFTRGSDIAATRINSSGLIEKYRENLLLQSNQFDTTWGSVNTTETSGQAGYDGTNDAWLLSITASGAYLYQDKAVSGVQTFSFFAKEGTLNRINVVINASVNVTANFDLANGIVLGGSQNITSSISSIENGWYRCSVTYDKGTTNRFRIYPAELAGGGTSGNIYIQDAQLERGLVATSYLESGATTAKAGVLDNLPRIDYTGGTASLLLEPSRTNLVEQSEYIGATEWVGAGATRDITITQTSETNPEGRAICWKIQGTSTDNQLANNSTTTSGTTITNSVYVKRVSGTGDVRLRNVNNTYQDFSLSVADGWKRIDITATATSATARFYLNLVDYTDEILVWGAQQEAGSYPTSYIPTYGTSVTRNGDSCLINPMDITYSTNYTFFGEFERIVSEDEESILMQLYDGNDSSNNQYRILNRTNAQLRTRIYYNGNNTSIISATDSFQLGQTIKWAVQYNSGVIKVFIDGQEIGNTTQTVGGIDVISLEKIRAKQILLFPNTLSDAECITLTT